MMGVGGWSNVCVPANATDHYSNQSQWQPITQSMAGGAAPGRGVDGRGKAKRGRPRKNEGRVPLYPQRQLQLYQLPQLQGGLQGGQGVYMQASGAVSPHVTAQQALAERRAQKGNCLWRDNMQGCVRSGLGEDAPLSSSSSLQGFYSAQGHSSHSSSDSDREGGFEGRLSVPDVAALWAKGGEDGGEFCVCVCCVWTETAVTQLHE